MNQKHFFDLNQHNGIYGIVCLSIAISFLCFSLAYFGEGVTWNEAFIEEQHSAADWQLHDYQNIASHWITSGIVSFIGAVILFILSIVFLSKNKKMVEKKNTIEKKYNFNHPTGFLSTVIIPVGIVFIINGMLYWVEAMKWEHSASINQIWYLHEASEWYNSSMIIFIIGIVLFCGGVLLLIINYRLNKNIVKKNRLIKN